MRPLKWPELPVSQRIITEWSFYHSPLHPISRVTSFSGGFGHSYIRIAQIERNLILLVGVSYCNGYWILAFIEHREFLELPKHWE